MFKVLKFSVLYFCSADLLAAVRPPAGVGGPVCSRGGAELLPDRLHPPSQRELWPAADLFRQDCQGHLQVHGHLHLGVSGVHDRHVQPVLLLPGSEAERCLHHVRSVCCFRFSDFSFLNY